MKLILITIALVFILVISFNEVYAQDLVIQLGTDKEKVDYCWDNFHNKPTKLWLSQALCVNEMNTMRDVCSSDSIDPLLINNGTMKAMVEGIEITPEEVEDMLDDGWTIVAPPICNDPLRSYRMSNFEIVEKETVISEESKEARALFDKYW